MSRLNCLLGQSIFGGESQSVPNLPDPPALVHYTVENQWPLLIGLSVVALVLFWMTVTGRAKDKKWVQRTGWALIPFCIFTALIAPYIKTDREALSEKTDEFVKLTAAADTGALSQMFAPEVSFRLLGGENRYSREQILDLVRQYPGNKAPIDWYKIDQHQAVKDGQDLGRTQVHVRVKSKEATMYAVPIGSWWRIDWRRSNGEWKVAGIEALQIDGASPGMRP